MPNTKYLAIQEECYQLAIEDEAQRKVRIKDLQGRFDPIEYRYLSCRGNVWVTQDYRVIPYVFMRASHLRNAYQHVYRQQAELFKKHSAERLNDEEKDRFINRQMARGYIRRELERRKMILPPENETFVKLYIEFYETLYPSRYDDWLDSWHPGHPDNFGDS